jgi:Na+-driven multidrug efflux pump
VPILSHNIRTNFSLAWPLAINAVLMQSMLMIDTLLVAPLGEHALAAMGIATTIMAFMLGIQHALSNGTQLILSRAQGSGQQPAICTAFWAGLGINLGTALFFWCGITVFGQQIVALVSDSPDLQRQAHAYLATIKYILIATSITQVLSAFFNSRGSTRIPLKGFVLELPVNIIISYGLINGLGAIPALGLQGAAWGSLVAIGFRLLFLAHMLNRSGNLGRNAPGARSVIPHAMRHLQEIAPIAANFIILSVGMTIYQLIYAQLSIYDYVAITLVFPWIRIGTQFITAWAQAAAITISQALGSGETSQLGYFIRECTRAALLASLFIALAFYLLSQSMKLIYPAIEPATLTALASIAPLYIFLPIVRTYNTLCGHILRSIGESLQVLRIHFVTQWLISIPACAILVIGFEASIFWAFAMVPVEELLKALPLSRRLRRSASSLAAGAAVSSLQTPARRP